MALQEKPVNFTCTHLSCLRDLLAEHVSKVAAEQPNAHHLRLLHGNLEQQEWQNAVETVRLDIRLQLTYLAKVQDVKSAMYWQDLEWRSKRRNDVERAVLAFMDVHVRLCANGDLDRVIKES